MLSVVLCGLLALALLAHYNGAVARANERAEAGAVETVRLVAQVITEDLGEVLSDLRYLSQQNELRDYLAHDGPLERERLGLELLAFVAQKRTYDQARVIGEDGRERVRVDYRGGDPVVVPPERLQDRRDRYYFFAIMQRPAGDVYVSPLDLNVDRGAIEVPANPVVRVGLPLFDRAGERRGLLLLNVRAEVLIQRTKAIARAGIAELWLLNADGYWLIGPGRDSEWGFMYPGGGGRTFAARYPQAWPELTRSVEGSVVLPDGWLRYRRVYPLAAEYALARAGGLAAPSAPQSYYWTVGALLPQAVRESIGRTVARDLAPGYAVLAGMLVPLAAGLAYASLRGRALGRLTATVLEHVPALIAYVDRDQRYRFSNQAYERLLGVRARDLDGRSVRDLVGESAYGRIRPYIEQVLRGEAVNFEEHLELGAAAPRDVSVSCVPDLGPGGAVQGFFSIISDVTRLKEAERRERARLLELAHLARVNSLGEMATELAHEVNQPLAAIAAYASACRRRLEASRCPVGEIPQWLEAIDAETRRAGEVVQRLRDLVGKVPVRPVPLDLNDVVTEVGRMIESEARSSRVEVAFELAPELPRVVVDRILIEQVVLNLLRNALEAVAGMAPDRRRVVVATRTVGEAVEVAVHDSGPGVSPELGRRVFEPFVTTREQGLGMGLAISRRIIEAHDGRLDFRGDAEVGTTFSFVLPAEGR